MGSPTMWYKEALENFAYLLLMKETNSISQNRSISESVDQMSIEELETTIQNNAQNFNNKMYFYHAGIAAAQMIEKAGKGCDSLNAAAGGLSEFEDLIGLYDDKTSL